MVYDSYGLLWFLCDLLKHNWRFQMIDNQNSKQGWDRICFGLQLSPEMS